MQQSEHGVVALKRGNRQCTRLGGRGRYRSSECMAWKFQLATQKSQGIHSIGSQTWVGDIITHSNDNDTIISVEYNCT